MRVEVVVAATVATGVLALVVWSRRERRRTRDFLDRYRAVDGLFFLSEVADVLPSMFAPWEAIALSLPELNRTGRLRSAVERLPVLRIGGAYLCEPELRRARVLLGLSRQKEALGEVRQPPLRPVGLVRRR